MQIENYTPILLPAEAEDFHAKQGRGWAVNYNKIHLWSLTNFHKVLNLDHDSLVLENLDHVFLMPDAVGCDCTPHTGNVITLISALWYDMTIVAAYHRALAACHTIMPGHAITMLILLSSEGLTTPTAHPNVTC